MMSRYDIHITEPAENELYEIKRYIEEELLEPGIARKMVNKIAISINTLEEMPFRNSLVADERLAKQGIRKTMVDNYVVFYCFDDKYKIVTIIRILYGKRDWINLL